MIPRMLSRFSSLDRVFCLFWRPFDVFFLLIFLTVYILFWFWQIFFFLLASSYAYFRIFFASVRSYILYCVSKTHGFVLSDVLLSSSSFPIFSFAARGQEKRIARLRSKFLHSLARSRGRHALTLSLVCIYHIPAFPFRLKDNIKVADDPQSRERVRILRKTEILE